MSYKTFLHLRLSALTPFAPDLLRYTKPSAHIGTYDAERVLELLHSHDQEFALERLVEIR